MRASDYNKYLAAIKAANDCEEYRAKELLRRIYADMVANYGANEDDVEYLFRKFRYHID